MTIDELNALTTLTAADEVPVWDSEESGEPTKKITASNLAASVKSLASLPNTTEMNTAIEQSTAITETELGATYYTAQVTYYLKRALKQNNRVTVQLSCVFSVNVPTGTVIATIPEGYRPSDNVVVPAILITDADVVLLTTVIVKSNGDIIQGSTGYCRKVYVCADYAL